MPTSVNSIIIPPFDEPLPPQWVEPSLVVFDDLLGPAAIQLIEESANANTSPASPEQIAVISRIDLETALPDRAATDDFLQDFATQHNFPFFRLDGSCESGCSIPADLLQPDTFVATPASSLAACAAIGGIVVPVGATDLAHAYLTARIWYRRPPLQTITFTGSLPDTTTWHDLAIHLRPQIQDRALVVIEFDQLDARDAQHSAETIVALLADSPASAVLIHPSTTYDDSTPTLNITLDILQPLIAPSATTSAPVSQLKNTPIHRAYIGSCSTGRIDDLRLAASVLHDNKVAIPTVIAPASLADAKALDTEKLDPRDPSSPTLAQIFKDSGCDIGLPGCAACVNGLAALAAIHSNENRPNQQNQPETVVATAVANVNAASDAVRILTASPTTAAASAIHARITAAPTHLPSR